jgi:hypothetical protein
VRRSGRERKGFYARPRRHSSLRRCAAAPPRSTCAGGRGRGEAIRPSFAPVDVRTSHVVQPIGSQPMPRPLERFQRLLRSGISVIRRTSVAEPARATILATMSSKTRCSRPRSLNRARTGCALLDFRLDSERLPVPSFHVAPPEGLRAEIDRARAPRRSSRLLFGGSFRQLPLRQEGRESRSVNRVYHEGQGTCHVPQRGDLGAFMLSVMLRSTYESAR